MFGVSVYVSSKLGVSVYGKLVGLSAGSECMRYECGISTWEYFDISSELKLNGNVR